MMKLSGFGITRRLYAVVGLVTVGLAVVAATAQHRLADVTQIAEQTEKARVPQLATVGHAELGVTQVSLQLRHAMLARDERERQAAVDELAAKRKALDDTLAEYERGLFTAEGKSRFSKVGPIKAEFDREAEANLALILRGEREAAFAYLVDRTIPARNRLLSKTPSTTSRRR